MSATIRVGTCSWADETLTKVWYPRGVRSGEARIRHYAERFDTVEANSTYYRLPDAELVGNWAERTPDGFTMHVKAFGLMTRHPVKLESLPEDLRDVMPVDERGRVDRPPRELRAEVFRRFARAVEPLRERGKLGGILLQFPPYIVYKPASLEYIEWAQAQLPGDEILVEFRHRSWLDEENRAQTLSFLESRGLTYVIVDAPKTEAKNLVPTVVAPDERDRLRALPRPQRGHVEQAHRERRGALRLPLLGGGAGGVGRAAARARRRVRVGLRDVQQQRPLGDAGDRPRGARAGGGRRRPLEGRGRAGARERADAEAPSQRSLTSVLPRFSPRSMPMNAAGAFSRPSVTSSR